MTELKTAYVNLTVGPEVGTVDLTVYTRVNGEEIELGVVSLPVRVEASEVAK